MSDAANFTEQEQWELDNEDPIMGLWRMHNETRARRLTLGSAATERESSAAGAGDDADHATVYVGKTRLRGLAIPRPSCTVTY